MSKRNLIAGGAVGIAALAIVAVSTFGVSRPASAQQLAQDASYALSHMSPSDADYKKFYPYFVDWVKQAQRAPDLRALSYDQLVQAYPEAAQEHPATGEPLRVIDNPSDGQKPDVRKLKYLEFSTTDGDTESKIVVGLNSQNIPEAALTHTVKAGKPRING